MSGSTGGSWKRNTLTTGAEMNNRARNRPVNSGYAPYRQGHVTAPAPDPTNLLSSRGARSRAGLGSVPVDVAPGGESLPRRESADARRGRNTADIAVAAHGVGELAESSVLLLGKGPGATI